MFISLFHALNKIKPVVADVEVEVEELKTLILDTDLAADSGDGMENAVISDDGLTVVIGAWKHGSNRGRLRVYAYSSGSWTNTFNITGIGSSSVLGNRLGANSDCTKIFARETNGSDRLSVFSFSGGAWSRTFTSTLGVISIPYTISPDSSGDNFIVGQFNYSGTPDGGNRGIIQIYTWNGSTYTNDFSYSPTTSTSYALGLKSAMNGAGNIAVSGAHDANKVLVFTNSGSGWAFTHTIDGPAGSSRFGRSVGMNKTGDLIAVGDDTYNSNDGRVHVYSGSGTSWTLDASMDAEDTGEKFGSELMMNGAGNRIIVTANQPDPANDLGRGYLIDLSGSTWSVAQTLLSVGTDAPSIGYTLSAISNSGNTVVAIEKNNDESSSNAGRAYIYTAAPEMLTATHANFPTDKTYYLSAFVDDASFWLDIDAIPHTVERTAENVTDDDRDTIFIDAKSGGGNKGIYPTSMTQSTWSNQFYLMPDFAMHRAHSLMFVTADYNYGLEIGIDKFFTAAVVTTTAYNAASVVDADAYWGTDWVATGDGSKAYILKQSGGGIHQPWISYGTTNSALGGDVVWGENGSVYEDINTSFIRDHEGIMVFIGVSPPSTPTFQEVQHNGYTGSNDNRVYGFGRAVNSDGSRVFLSDSFDGNNTGTVLEVVGPRWVDEYRNIPQSFSACFAGTSTIFVSRRKGDDGTTDPAWLQRWDYSNNTWSLTQNISATAYNSSSEFGHQVAASGDGEVVAVTDRVANNKAGAVYVFRRSSGTYPTPTATQAIAGSHDWSATNAVSIDADGTTLAIGQSGWHPTNRAQNGAKDGRVTVYTWNGSSYASSAVLTLPRTGKGFGLNVGINTTATRIMVNESLHSAGVNGQVHIYDGSGSTWSLSQTISAVTSTWYVAHAMMSSDGSTVAVVEISAINSSTCDGQLLVYKHNGTEFAVAQQENAPNSAAGFGAQTYSEGVAISGDGSIVAVPQYQDRKAFIYKTPVVTAADNRATILDADIPAFNTTHKVSNERSRISRDGTTLLLPSSRDNTLPGRLEIFTKVNGTWTSQYGIEGFNNGASLAVANDINSDGTMFITNNRLGSGVQQFEIHELSGGTWARRDQVTHNMSGMTSAAINGAGDVVGIGYQYDGGGSYPGRVRIFQYSGSTWSQVGDFAGAGTDYLGSSIAMNEAGDVCVAGGPQHSDGVNRVGQIRVFTNQGGTWGQRATLDGPSGYDLSRFGWTVDIDDAGETIVGGGWTYGSNNDGVVMIFTGSQSTWSVASTIYGQQTGEQFGWRTAISGDGQTVVVRASGNSESGTASTGRGYVITRFGYAFSVTEDVAAQQLGEAFGLDDISQDGAVVVGAGALNDETATDAGRYYVFNRSDANTYTFVMTTYPNHNTVHTQSDETTNIGIHQFLAYDDTGSLVPLDNESNFEWVHSSFDPSRYGGPDQRETTTLGYAVFEAPPWTSSDIDSVLFRVKTPAVVTKFVINYGRQMYSSGLRILDNDGTQVYNETAQNGNGLQSFTKDYVITAPVIATSMYSSDADKKAACTFDIYNLDTALHADFTIEFDIRNFAGTWLRFGFGLSPISPRNAVNTEAYFYINNWGTSTAVCVGDFNSTTIQIATTFDMTSYDTTEWINVKLVYDEANSGLFRLYLNDTAIGAGASSTWSAHSGLTNFAVGYRPLASYDGWMNDMQLKDPKFNGEDLPLYAPPVVVMDAVFDPAPTGSYIETNGSGSNADGTLIAPATSFTTVSGVTLLDGTTTGRVADVSSTYYQVAQNGAHKGFSTIETIVQFTNSTGDLADLSAYTQFDDNLFVLGNYSDKTFICIKSSDGALHTLIADSTASSTYTDGNAIKYRELVSTSSGVVEPNKWHVITVTFESPGAHGNNTMETVKTYVDGVLVMTADISSYSSSTWYILIHRDLNSPFTADTYYQRIRSYDLVLTAEQVLERYEELVPP